MKTKNEELGLLLRMLMQVMCNQTSMMLAMSQGSTMDSQELKEAAESTTNLIDEILLRIS